MRPGIAALVGLVVCGSACNAKDAAESRVNVFVDRHGPHMKAIAHELAPKCPAAFAGMSPDGAAIPGSSEPPSPLPFGTLVQEKTVLQVAASCVKDGSGTIVASLRDPFAEDGAALPPNGCQEIDLETGGGDTMKACFDPQRPTRASVLLRHPIEGGSVDVITIFRLTRK